MRKSEGIVILFQAFSIEERLKFAARWLDKTRDLKCGEYIPITRQDARFLGATMPFIAAIAAMAENRVIGKNNQLPWRLPADLKHFKALTLNHAVIMGRKTYDSIGKPLPQRLNIILSREKTLLIPGCTVTHDIEAAIAAAASASDIFVIGGTQIYELFLPRIKRIYLTTIHHTFDGDQYFPALPENQWKAISHEYHAADADNAYNYTFSVLEAV